VSAVSADGDYAIELDPARLAEAEGVDVRDADPEGEITISGPGREAEAPQAPASPASAG
jgi:hypothetical protein